MKSEEVIAELNTNKKSGLSEKEAAARLKRCGENRLDEPEEKSAIMHYLPKLNNILPIVLMVFAAFAMLASVYMDNFPAYVEAALILAIVLSGAALCSQNEYYAWETLDNIQKSSDVYVRVFRDGVDICLNSRMLVPGDVIRLKRGDFVPADARLIEADGLVADEETITGKPGLSEKNADMLAAEDAPLAEKRNMVFFGTNITAGTAIAVVTQTGRRTVFGKLTGLLASDDDMQIIKQLKRAGKILGAAAFVLYSVIFLTGLFVNIPSWKAFITALSLAASAIPWSLPATAMVILAVGASRLAGKKILLKRLSTIETLGRISAVCTDKTGVVTQNKMSVGEVYADEDLQTTDFSEDMPEKIRELMSLAVLCNNALVAEDCRGNEDYFGNQSDAAIANAAASLGIKKSELEIKYPRVFDLPFDSKRKRMSVIVRLEDKYLVIVKGAMEEMTGICTQGGDDAIGADDDMARRGLRVIAVTYKLLDELPEDLSADSIENDLTFFGEIGLVDPPRKGVAEAVDELYFAGVAVVMVAGDQTFTVSAIGHEVGIYPADKYAADGRCLDLVKKCGEKIPNLERTTIYGRVTPENKEQIVEAWQEAGHVVAVTGSRTEEARSLRQADVGFALANGGTEAAKAAADVVITDNSFVSIVNAIRFGRGIYANVQKAISYLLSINAGEVLAIFAAMLIWHELPLASVQFLWINLITSSLLTVALGAEDPDPDVLDRLPREEGASVFANGTCAQIAVMAPVFAFFTLVAYFLGKCFGGISGGQTLAFMVLARMQIIHSYSMRSTHSLFDGKILGNKKLNNAALISHALTYALLFTPLGKLFGFMEMPFRFYVYTWMLSFIPVLVTEIFKYFNLKREENIDTLRNIKKMQNDPDRFSL